MTGNGNDGKEPGRMSIENRKRMNTVEWDLMKLKSAATAAIAGATGSLAAVVLHQVI